MEYAHAMFPRTSITFLALVLWLMALTFEVEVVIT